MTLSLIALISFIGIMIIIGYRRLSQKVASFILSTWIVLTILSGSWHYGIWVLIALTTLILAIINTPPLAYQFSEQTITQIT